MAGKFRYAARCVFLAAPVMALPALPASPRLARADTRIVVDPRPFGSPKVAATAEAKVNWHDADVSDDAACTECFAAVELQRYLRKLTGREDDFALVSAARGKTPAGGRRIVLTSLPGRTPQQQKDLASSLGMKLARLKALGPQGYCIRTPAFHGRREEATICIVGGGRVGVLYGAYDLLHRLGCRWFAPETIHEEVPRADLARLGELNVTQSPSFVTRGFHAWENRGGRAFLLWMARNRLNYWCVQEADHPFVRKLGIRMSCGGHTAQRMFLNPDAAYPYDHAKFKGDEKKPRDPYRPGKDYRGDADKDGKLTYFEAHPEWFAMVGGRRVPGIRGEFGTNYCTSNADATTEFFTHYVRALTDGPYRDADVVRFWTLDGGKWCQCEACKALGTPTDRNLLLVHRLDREIRKARAAGKINRPLIIRFLVYHDVLAPPTRPLPKGFDYETCTATYFPIVRSYVYDFLDKRSPRNARYHRQLVGWTTDPDRHYRGQLCIGEYYNVSGYKCLPVCYMHTMAKDIPTYYRFGARHFHYMHVVTANMGNKALTNYQMARQLWDVKSDCEALWQDYFSRRYGPAGETMRKFYESLERMFCNVTELKYNLARRLNAGSANLFPSPQLRYERKAHVTCNGPTFVEIVAAGKTCRKLIDSALASEDLPKRIRARIEEDERLFTYGERTIGYYHACIRAFQCVRAKQADEARRHLADAEKLAVLLRKDTTSTKHSSSHANASNAFVASRAGGAIPRIRKALSQR